MSEVKSFFVFVSFLTCLAASSNCFGQIIDNGSFDEGLNHWFAKGTGTIEITNDGYESENACLIANRTQHWHGIQQSIAADLVEGKDYHLVAYVKTTDVPRGPLRFEISQTDDRGMRFLSVGEIEAVDSEWTMLQGGFTLETIGPLTELTFSIVGTPETEFFDFIVDSIEVTENEWVAEANARIEQIRKRDIELTVQKPNGDPAENHSLEVNQIRHHFKFGSTLNAAVIDNTTYADFFKDNFEFATIEWYSQWKPVEKKRGVEDYAIADASLAFAQSNAIPVKGHALFWGDPIFRPTWLDPLSPSALETELDERITNIVSRYRSKFYGWDVNNEMLNHDYFQEQLGESIRPWMFQKAKEIDPNTKLFTNEFALTVSQLKSKQYRSLVQSLQANGAPVDGICLQSHFNSFVSVKGIEIALSELEDLGAEIWFSEYDTVNPDADNRADALESFYRYAFSRPEANGIVMWGFWAGTHWLGPDASIVDLDWTVNAAGQRYLDLIDEWSTNFSADAEHMGQLNFRGFHGDYIVTTTDLETEIVNHHLLRVEPGETALQRNLVTSNEDNVLLIYGTEGDDLFEYDFENPFQVFINGTGVMVDQNFGSVQFVGLGGADHFDIKSKTTKQNFYTTSSSITPSGSSNRIRYSQIETVSFISQNEESTTTFVDSPADDLLVSYPESTLLITPSHSVSVEGFETVRCISNTGSDLATVYDSPSSDSIQYQPSEIVDPTVTIDDEDSKRRWFRGFSETIVISELGVDVADIFLPVGIKAIDVSPELTTLTVDGDVVQFSNTPRSYIWGSDDPDNPSDNINIVGSPGSERLRIASATTLYEGDSFWKLFVGVDQFTNSNDTTGNDVLLFFDSPGDDQLSVNQDSATISSQGLTHTLNFFDAIRAYGNQGDTNTAVLNQPTANVRLFGDWIE